MSEQNRNEQPPTSAPAVGSSELLAAALEWIQAERRTEARRMTTNPLWNLDKMIEKATAAPLPPVTSSRAEQAGELIRRCDARDANLAQRALEAERAGDQECCWMNMAARAENKRFRDRLVADLAAMVEHENDPSSETARQRGIVCN